MKSVNLALLACALVLIVACFLVNGGPVEEPDKARESRLPKIFDFKVYKVRYHKNYRSFVEELARRKYFLSRAFRTFVSYVKYKWRQLSYYLALNMMSDYSPQEMDMMKNKLVIEKEIKKRKRYKLDSAPSPAHQANDVIPRVDELDISDEEVENKLREIAHDHPNDPAYKEILATTGDKAALRRRKRSPVGAGAPSLRLLNPDALIKPAPDKSAELSGGISGAANVKLSIASNNPKYEPPVLSTQGLDDQQERVTWHRIKGANEPTLEASDSFLTNIRNYMEAGPEGHGKIKEVMGDLLQEHEKNCLPDDAEVDEAKDKPDAVFVDHRGTCIGTVRQQGTCGSCYAFASIAMLEWIYCKRKGAYTPFSEQYIVDCGSYVDGLNGCDGGDSLSVVDFIHNFGAELKIAYPYRMQSDTCPYSRETDLNTVGYIRPNLGSAVVVPRRKWGNYIKYTPLMTSIFTNSEFAEYGGGVHVLSDCNKDSGHAMMIVGHGREDGQEYWLLRNSYSVGWGEEGYYKLSKKSNADCISVDAYAFGTTNGVKIDAAPQINKLYDKSVLQQHKQSRM